MSSSDVNPPPCIGLHGTSWQAILASITPTKEDDKKLQSCFDKIKRILSDECKLGNVVKVGSYGKKTHIKIENKLPDIDIVIFYPKFNPTEEEHSKKIHELHETVKKYAKDFTNIKTTLYSVQAIVDGLNIDMLPAMELDDATRFIMKMKDNSNMQRCLSACTSLTQKCFIKAQPNRYKEMVRLVKYWKSKQQWTSDGSAPISYLLELLMLDVYNRYAHLETDTSIHGGLFQRFLDLISKLSSKTRITFNMYYHETIANGYHQKMSDTVGDTPVILDPANPSMNVAAHLTNLQPLREYAQLTLIELQVTMSRFIDKWTNTQQRLLSRSQRLVTFQNLLLKMKKNHIFSIENIKLSTLQNVQSQPGQTGPYTFRIGADIETVDTNKKYWRVYLLVENVDPDWLEFKNDILGTSGNFRIDFNVQATQNTNVSYESISKQWKVATITKGQKVYITTKDDKLKRSSSEQTFNINDYYTHYNMNIKCEVIFILFP